MAEFVIRGWYRRLRAALTGRVDAVSAPTAPVVVRQYDNGISIQHLGPNPFEAGRPTIYAEWPGA